MSKVITPNGFNATTVGTQTVRIGWDGALDSVSASEKLSLGFLPANAVIKAARGTVITAEGASGNLLLAYSTDSGENTSTILTVDANGAAGTRTNAPASVDATGATSSYGSLLDTGTSALYELFLLGSAALDAAQVVIDLDIYFGPTAGTDGTGALSL